MDPCHRLCATREIHIQLVFWLRPDRFVFIPYHTTLAAHKIPNGEVEPGSPYVFAGGTSQRDYETFFRAVAALSIRVIVAVPEPQHLRTKTLPSNVEVLSTDHKGFLQLTRGAAVNVIPLTAGPIRSAGQQSFLNAMALGTVTVVTDPDGAGDYIQNWRNGVLLPAGDVDALRTAIKDILEDPELANQIRAKARRARESYATERILNHYVEFLKSKAFTDLKCTEYGTD